MVNHIDGNKTNNVYTNLEWVTPKENTAHAIEIGLLDNSGESHVNSKLTNKEVLGIRALIGTILQKDIAKLYDISEMSVSLIKRRKRWKHI